jgi:hypothetical protein
VRPLGQTPTEELEMGLAGAGEVAMAEVGAGASGELADEEALEPTTGAGRT